MVEVAGLTGAAGIEESGVPVDGIAVVSGCAGAAMTGVCAIGGAAQKMLKGTAPARWATCKCVIPLV